MATKNKINKDVKQAEEALRNALGNAYKQGFERGGDTVSQTILPQLENLEAQIKAIKEAILVAKDGSEIEITIEKAKDELNEDSSEA